MSKESIIREFNSRAEAYFKGLRFIGKSHEYFVGEKKIPKSVSALIKSFEVKTDFGAIAKHIDKRDNLAPGTTQALWTAKNKLACDAGSDTHDFAEKLDTPNVRAIEAAKQQAVVHFWSELFQQYPGRYFLVRRELPMYHKKYNFSGTCDFILYDTYTNKFIIGDYKTNEDLFKNFKEKMLLEPFEYLLDCPYNFYQLQLSFYQLLVQQLEYEVSERWIIWLKSDESYVVYKAHDYSNYLEEWIIEEKNLKLLQPL